MTQTILIIDDDARLADMVSRYLQPSGFDCHIAASGEAGLTLMPQLRPDAVLLDVMLPGIDGLEVCRRLRALPGALARTPVLMLTAKGDPMDRVVGLELGADDYLPKPFEPRELLARLRAVLRRQAASGADGEEADALCFGRLCIEPSARRVCVDDRVLELTSFQFDLLLAMAQRAGRVLSREQLMELVRGRELEAFDRSIDVHVGRIRQAIEDDTKQPQRILTVRGVGYVFAKQQD